MTEKTYEAYAYAELSEEAKAVALAKEMEFLGENWEPSEWPIDGLRTKAEARGFDVTEHNFSGFWSQGDGASFEGSVNVAQWLAHAGLTEEYAALDLENLHMEVYRTGTNMSVHEMTMRVHVEYRKEATGEEELLIVKLQESVLEDARGLARDYYRDLEKDYDDYTSKESAEYLLMDNGCLFLEDGESDPFPNL